MMTTTPEEFEKQIKEIVQECNNDPERYHSCIDNAVWDLLNELGYSEASVYIKTLDLWYA